MFEAVTLSERTADMRCVAAQLRTFMDPHGHARPVEVDGRVVGFVLDTDEATICQLGGIQSRQPQTPRGEQARETWGLIEEALLAVGMDFSDVVRTWLYVDRILEWYGEFNRVRNEFFLRRDVFSGLVPASTGVGMANPCGSALVADVLAIRPKSEQVRVVAVPSPLQCPALDYKSSFSRAVEVAAPGLRRLYISGTASIDPCGMTAHAGDVRKQLERTMEVVHAILESRGMDWGDISRAVAYLRDMRDVAEFTEHCRVHHLPPFPCAVSHADLCRDDLLFEIEADAITTWPM